MTDQTNDIETIKEFIERSNGIVTPQNYFIQVPNSFMRSKKLNTNEKILYLYLLGFGGESKRVYPSHARMMSDLHWSKNKILKVLKSLEQKNGIYIINRINKDTKEKATNIYYLSEIDNNTGNFIRGYLDLVKRLYPDNKKYF